VSQFPLLAFSHKAIIFPIAVLTDSFFQESRPCVCREFSVLWKTLMALCIKRHNRSYLLLNRVKMNEAHVEKGYAGMSYNIHGDVNILSRVK
jgi:hypothetical protein